MDRDTYDDLDPRVQEARQYTGGQTVNSNLVDPDAVREEYGDSRPPQKEPHTEGPNYEEWANGFENANAVDAFAGLWGDEE